ELCCCSSDASSQRIGNSTKKIPLPIGERFICRGDTLRGGSCPAHPTESTRILSRPPLRLRRWLVSLPLRASCSRCRKYSKTKEFGSQSKKGIHCQEIVRKMEKSSKSPIKGGSAYGNRTRLSALRGPCP